MVHIHTLTIPQADLCVQRTSRMYIPFDSQIETILKPPLDAGLVVFALSHYFHLRSLPLSATNPLAVSLCPGNQKV